MASSSYSFTCGGKYDVFLSFRMEDTGNNFTSHLYYALCRNKIETFSDDQLEKGDEILPGLLKTIEESKISIIIFSENYASSERCLDELVKIIDSKKKNGQIVIPVYYHVNPMDVRNQTGSFKDAFIKHRPEKLQEWKDALTEASNLCGWDSSMTKPESTLVDKIVTDICKKLKSISPSRNFQDLVEIDSHKEQSKSSHNNITGVGKTNIVELEDIKITSHSLLKGGSNAIKFHFSRRCHWKAQRILQPMSVYSFNARHLASFVCLIEENRRVKKSRNVFCLLRKQ